MANYMTKDYFVYDDSSNVLWLMLMPYMMLTLKLLT